MANPFFNAAYYLAQNADVKAAGLDAEAHYLQFGAKEGRAPTAWFNAAYYLSQNPDLEKGGITISTAFAHFQAFGSNEGRSPSPSVSLTKASLSGYAAANADLAKAFGITDPAYLTEAQASLLAGHYYQFGVNEGRPGNPAVAPAGGTFTLTVGADAIVGTTGNDVINALSINAAGTAASTLTTFDSIDGGTGNDTLNIYTTATENKDLPANVTVKNVETVNVYNSAAAAALGDASKFQGVTTLNQIGALAADVTNLAGTTTAGFNGTTQAAIKATATATATTATIALTGVAEATTLAVNAAAGGKLNSVTVSGTRVDATPATPIDNLALTITAGKDVESVAINTAINSTLAAVSNEAGSTKVLSTVDASASTGAISYVAAATVANIKTGSGKDVVTLATALDATTKAASIASGEGDDTLTITAGAAAPVVGGTTVTVDAGAGKDIVNLTISANSTYVVQAGAGDDTVVVTTGTVKTTDKIDGGEGIDTISLAAKATYAADDYIVFNKVLTNFETLALTGATTGTLDASQLAATYTTIDINAGSSVTKVGTQALVANGDVTATAAGYIAAVPPASATYAGSLNITEKATGIVTANAASVALTIDASKAGVTGTLEGFAQSVSVNLVQALNTAKTAYLGNAAFELTNSATVQTDLATLKLSGNGTATVVNAAATKLVSVDASGLNSVTFDGKAASGLTYTSSNALAETIKLGAGLDVIKLNASTYGATDTVEGLNLVLNAGKTALDATKSDDINLTAVATFKKFTTTQTDLDLALKDAAASADANLVFQLGGNTYIYQDTGAADLLETTDTLVKLTGAVDLDALVFALAA